jgi:hypothetical protein
MAPAVVQSVTGTASSTAGVLDLTLPGPTTSGNTIVVFAAAISTGDEAGAASATLGGSAGNFAPVDAACYSDDGDALSVWADPDCAGSETALVISSYGTAGTYYLAGAAYEISGLEASALDVAAYNFSNGEGGWSVTGPATAQASEIWLGAAAIFESTSAVTITGPGSPWTDTPQLTETTQCALMAGYQAVSSTGTPDYGGSVTASGFAIWVASLITLRASTVTAGTGGIRMPPRSLAGTAGETFTGPGALRMPARSLAATGGEQFTASGNLIIPPRSVSGTAAGNTGMVMPRRSLSGTGAVSPIGSGGVVMPSRSPAGSAAERITGTGSMASAAPSLAGAGEEVFPGSGSLHMPSRSPGGTGVSAQQARGDMVLPSRSLSGAGKETIAGTGSVRALKFTLSGTVGEQPRGSGGVVMPRMALAGAGKLPVRQVWRTPDKVHKSGAVMQ